MRHAELKIAHMVGGPTSATPVADASLCVPMAKKLHVTMALLQLVVTCDSFAPCRNGETPNIVCQADQVCTKCNHHSDRSPRQ
jgi:hypothetical protein